MIEHTSLSSEQGRARAACFDPNTLSPAFYDDPYPTYAALREFDPVHRCPDGTYFLTRYADLDQIYRDRNHFSSDKKSVFGPKFSVGSPLYEHHTTSLVFNDPPYHTRVRRPIVGALTPHVLQAMQPQIVALVDRLLDRLEERCWLARPLAVRITSHKIAARNRNETCVTLCRHRAGEHACLRTNGPRRDLAGGE